MTFAVGDLVRLKGGSPVLTVMALDKTAGRVHVAWFALGVLGEGYLPAAALHPASDLYYPDPRTGKFEALKGKSDV